MSSHLTYVHFIPSSSKVLSQINFKFQSLTWNSSLTSLAQKLYKIKINLDIVQNMAYKLYPSGGETEALFSKKYNQSCNSSPKTSQQTRNQS